MSLAQNVVYYSFLIGFAIFAAWGALAFTLTMTSEWIRCRYDLTAREKRARITPKQRRYGAEFLPGRRHWNEAARTAGSRELAARVALDRPVAALRWIALAVFACGSAPILIALSVAALATDKLSSEDMSISLLIVVGSFLPLAATLWLDEYRLKRRIPLKWKIVRGGSIAIRSMSKVTPDRQLTPREVERFLGGVTHTLAVSAHRASELSLMDDASSASRYASKIADLIEAKESMQLPDAQEPPKRGDLEAWLDEVARRIVLGDRDKWRERSAVRRRVGLKRSHPLLNKQLDFGKQLTLGAGIVFALLVVTQLIIRATQAGGNTLFDAPAIFTPVLSLITVALSLVIVIVKVVANRSQRMRYSESDWG